MRRLFSAIVTVVLSALPAAAVTRYVAVSGSCVNHASVGTSYVSCADSLSNGCTQAKPCCYLYDANSAASASDEIEVHHGTYNTTDTDANNLCYSGSYGALKITKASTTWARASGDTPTVDLANTRHGGLYVAADGVTIDGFTIIGQKTTGNDTDRCGSIGSSGVSGNVTIKNNSISWDGDGTNNCAACSVGIRMDFDENSVIENNTISGPYSQSMWTVLPTVIVTSNTNVIIRNNTITSTRSVGERHIGISIEGPEGTNVVYSIYKNTIKKTNGDTGVSKGIVLRDHTVTSYVYNNYIDDHNDGILLQDDQDVQVEQAYIFNNTIQGCVYGLRWPEAYHADVRNNYFECSSSGVRYDSCNPNNCNATICGDVNCATCDRCDTMDQVDSNDTLEYNVTKDAVKVNAANCPGTCPEPTSANNTVGTCTLDGSFKISNSGNCYNTGMNNPVGQGANTCSASGVSCLVDFEGETRPQSTGWDVGWDEYQEAGGGSAGSVLRGATVKGGTVK